jgi:uncharacterized membrane protein
MRNENIFVRILVNMVVGALIGALLLGLFALLVAGWSGMLNGIILGASIGAFGGLGILGRVDSLGYWLGFTKRYGEGHHKQQNGESE